VANLSFDFNKIKRTFFNVTLKDGRKLVVKMPMKKTFEKISSLQEVDENEMSMDDALDTLGGLCAEILSNNMTSEKVDTKYMTDNYDIEEMQLFIESYYNFAAGVKDNPN
jgi:hypothetical protein